MDAAFRVDLAWLQVTVPIQEYTANLYPVRLAAQGETLYTGTGVSAEIAGWGSTSDDNTPIVSDVLQIATLNISSASQCNAALAARGQFPGVSTSYVCGSALGMGACLTDTGGPLTRTEGGLTKQIGVFSVQTSADGTCGVNGDETVYTRVDLYRDYIQSYIDDPLFNVAVKSAAFPFVVLGLLCTVIATIL